MYKSSLWSQTTTAHPVTREFVPKPPPVLAELKNQGEFLCKEHRVFLGGTILLYNHSVGNFSMLFLVWLFLFFPYTDVLEVCLKPKPWTLFANVGFSCNMIQFWCVCGTENLITTRPEGRNTRQNKSPKVLCKTEQSWQWDRASNGQCPLLRTAAAKTCFACTMLIRQCFPEESINYSF